jgi:repressor LexA
VDAPLTPIQAKVLDAVRRRADRGQPPPTYRELCAEFGWGSTGTARDHLQALARKGYLELSGGHRSVRLREERPALTRVPLVGRVVAGVPVTSEEHAEAMIAVPAQWTARGSYFALRVSGDSMRDAGILDGDEAVVRRQATAKDDDIVVATLDGETTLKRLQLRGSRARLVAENPRYRPIDIRTESAIIHGVVVGLMRAYRPATATSRRLARASSSAFTETHAHRA